jgi:hypothetical protein
VAKSIRRLILSQATIPYLKLKEGVRTTPESEQTLLIKSSSQQQQKLSKLRRTLLKLRNSRLLLSETPSLKRYQW